MRLQELFESTEEDRALISLSSSIYTKLQDYAYGVPEYTDKENESFSLGKIGDLFNTSIPALDNITISVQSDSEMFRRAQLASVDVTRDPYKEFISGIWDASTNEIVFNEDHLYSNNMKVTVTHELRHALDDVKSGYKAGDSKHYFPAANRDKYSDVPDDTPVPSDEYKSQKGEINARFVEVLHGMVPAIRRAFSAPPDQIKARIMKELRTNLAKKEIANLFPEKEKSTQYKRLVSRAMDFITKEIAHHESELAKKGTPKKATGSF